MEFEWISSRRLFDFHHGDRRPMELWRFDGHPLDPNFYVGNDLQVETRFKSFSLLK